MAEAEIYMSLSLQLRDEAKSLRNAVQPYVTDLKRSAVKKVLIPTRTESEPSSELRRKIGALGD